MTLMKASALGHGHIISNLIGHKAHLDSTDRCGATTLHYALYFGNTVEIVSKLLDAKCPLNGRDESGITPLSIAADRGLDDAFSILIKAKADLEAATDEHGVSPLVLAQASGHQGIIEMILKPRGVGK